MPGTSQQHTLVTGCSGIRINNNKDARMGTDSETLVLTYTIHSDKINHMQNVYHRRQSDNTSSGNMAPIYTLFNWGKEYARTLEHVY